MSLSKDIRDYYERLAPTYDQNRFGNTYGQYIHKQEEQLLNQLLPSPTSGSVLDLACGTGRHLQHATHGLDLSPAMIAQAQQKFPTKTLHQGSVLQTPYPDGYFSTVYAFHLFMHLQRVDLKNALDEMYRIVQPGGQFLFDIPSKKRRKLTHYQASSWHGAFSLSKQEIETITQGKWYFQSYHGILSLPIHRFPNALRLPLGKVDNWFGRSPAREYASYLLVQLRKV